MMNWLRLAPFDNSSLSVMLRRQGVWQLLFEETQRLRRLSFDSMNCDSFGRDHVIISGEIRMLSPGDSQGTRLRLSASLRRRDGHFLVCGLHASVPGQL